MKDLANEVEVGYDALGNVLGYLYSGNVKDMPKEIASCVDDECCKHLACRPAVDFMVEVLYVAFRFGVVELVQIYQVVFSNAFDFSPCEL